MCSSLEHGHGYLNVGNFVISETRSEEEWELRARGRTSSWVAPTIFRVGLLAAVLCLVGCLWRSAARPTRHPAGSAGPLDILQRDALPQATFAAAGTLKPIEQLHDGNVCDNSEEFFAGLCYKKCALLTRGEAPIRTSSWTCCKSHPCTLNQVGSFGSSVLCTGFDVAADGSCPHKPGACLLDEELHLGICYKKCGILTGGAFPHRIAAATCCKTTGLGCLNIFNDKTSKAFDVGGGAGDHDPSTPAGAHPPEEKLTEAVETVSDAPLVAAGPGPALASLQPAEHVRTGNLCGANEEVYAGLCYRKCSLLTNGEAPIRTSSWTCCEGHPCLLHNQRGSLGRTLLCNGFDVAGDGSCPHQPGACLDDEELHLGVCYKKCSLLTNGAYPHRFAAATCCKAKGAGCFNFRNDLTRTDFDVGGGGRSSNDTRAGAQLPDQSLTEAAGDNPDQAVQQTGQQGKLQELRKQDPQHSGRPTGGAW